VWLAVVPAAVLAHVKWFEDPAQYPLRADLIVSSRTVLLLCGCVIALALLWSAQRLLGSAYWPELPFLRQMAIGAPTLLAVQAAIGLVNAATTPALFAPQLRLGLDALGLALAAVQLLIAFSFITGLLDWAAALVLIGLGPIAFGLFRADDVLEQLFWVGIGVVLLAIGRYSVRGDQARFPGWSGRAIAALRVIAGIAILVPTLTEKLWNPDIALAFLEERPHFNVLRFAGVDDPLFVLMAGVVEGVIGVALASGLLTRVVILGMWLPFNAGIPFLPAQELLGHLPILGIMYFLLVHGRGEPQSGE
jgi:hypothetical protein